jgi:hypothetical protein
VLESQSTFDPTVALSHQARVKRVALRTGGSKSGPVLGGRSSVVR